MKKKLCLLLVLFLAIFSYKTVNAQIVSMDLKESVEDEILSFKDYSEYKNEVKALQSLDLKDYKADSNKVKVYIFRTSVCPHCLDAIVYVSSLYKEYGAFFDLATFDVRTNGDNAELMTKVGEALNVDTSGVPVVIVGEKAFSGWASSLESEVLNLIKEYNENDDYVDAVSEIIKGTYNKKDENEDKANIIVSYVILGITVIIIGAILVSRKNTSYYDDDNEVISNVEVDEKKDLAEEKIVKKVKSEAKNSTTKKTTTKKSTNNKSTAKKSTKKKTTKK